MLYGPPGTGKTLLAKAVAGEAGAAFFAMSGSDFVEMYVGVGAGRVRDLFAKARAATPAIIFIDEVDAIGAKRGGSPESGGSNREADQTLNQLLVEMDGFGGNERLLVIAATNRLDTLDPALLRPGRFSRHIHVGAPSEEGRLAILDVHAKGKPLAEDVDLPHLAKVTAGASGAELAEMLNEGAIMAARAEHSQITHEDLFEGFLRVVAGPRKASSMLAAGEREAIAYHEAGHVLTAELCPTVDKTLHATINPRGQAAGFAVIGRSDRALHTAQHIHEQLIYILGGRAAEHVIFSTVSSGAANDLEKANEIARTAVERLRPLGRGRPGRRHPLRRVDGGRRQRGAPDRRGGLPRRDRARRGAPRAARAPHPGPAGRGRHRPPRDRRRDGGLDARRSPPEPAAAPRARARAGRPSPSPSSPAPAASGCRARPAPGPRSRPSAPSVTRASAGSPARADRPRVVSIGTHGRWDRREPVATMKHVTCRETLLPRQAGRHWCGGPGPWTVPVRRIDASQW